MANKEWFITKIVGTVVLMITFVSLCIQAANIVVNLENDVGDIEIRVDTHERKDSAQWSKAWDEIEKNEDDIHRLELQNTRMETNQKEIIRRLDELHRILSTFEVVQ